MLRIYLFNYCGFIFHCSQLPYTVFYITIKFIHQMSLTIYLHLHYRTLTLSIYIVKHSLYAKSSCVDMVP